MKFMKLKVFKLLILNFLVINVRSIISNYYFYVDYIKAYINS